MIANRRSDKLSRPDHKIVDRTRILTFTQSMNTTG